MDADFVQAIERALVAAATGGERLAVTRDAGVLAAMGAVASRFLAVGTPRTFGVFVSSPEDIEAAQLSLAAHRTWFAPRELRSNGGNMAGFATVPVEQVLACDIVCIHASTYLRGRDLRRGTHVNVLATASLDEELERVATIVREPGLAELAAGLVDGRQLDELTVFLAR